MNSFPNDDDALPSILSGYPHLASKIDITSIMAYECVIFYFKCLRLWILLIPNTIFVHL